MESAGLVPTRTSLEQEFSLNHSTSITASPLNDLPSTWKQSATTLLFVDAGVKNYQTLVAGAQPGTEVHVLDVSQDAIAQISQVLTGRSDIASIQIVSHGTSGGIKLGEAWLDGTTLDRYTNQVRAWSTALTQDADILLYGCDVANGDRTFIDRLATLTGADVAASDDLTGSVALGGDWDLEVQTGHIESGSALSQASRDRFSELLDLRLNWAQRPAADSAESIGVDGTGNTYVASASLTLGGWGVRLSKLDSQGVELWTKFFDTKAQSNIFKVAVDATGVINLMGGFTGTTTIGNKTLSTGAKDDIFIAQLDTTGTTQWANKIGGSGQDSPVDLAIDAQGNLYATGTFQGKVDFDPGANKAELTSSVASIFILKWDKNGVYQWAKGTAGSGFIYSRDIAVDASGAVYVGGEFSETVTYASSASTLSMFAQPKVNGDASSDAFLFKLDSTTGNLTWSAQLGSNEDDMLKSITTDAANNVYFAGEFRSQFSTGINQLTSAGGTDIFLARATSAGVLQWVKGFGSASDEELNGIAIAGSSLHLGGSFTGTVDFDPGIGTKNLTAVGRDGYLSEFDLAGNALNAIKLGGAGNDTVKSVQAAQGKFYVAGVAGLDADLDPSDTGTKTISTGSPAFVSRFFFNLAPVLANAPLVIPEIDEDAVTNNGTFIKDLVTVAITDTDIGAQKGIAITAIDNTNGAWQYSLDGGTNWTAIATVSETAALLLAGNDTTTRIRFVPNANYNGTANISLRAWDQTSGTNGGTANVTVNGADTAFSTQAVQATLKINAVNDAPISTPDIRADLTVTEDTPLTFKLGLNDVEIALSDLDLGTNVLEVTLSATQGTLSLASTANLTFTTGDGTDDAAITFKGKLADVNTAIKSLTYKGKKDFAGADTINFSVSDLGSVGSDGAQVLTKAIAVTVNPVNDAPVGADAQAITAEDTAIANGKLPVATDVEKNPITYELLPGAVGGVATVDSATGAYTFTPTLNFNGAASFKYRVKDDQAANNTSPDYTVTITVTPVNDAPTSADSDFKPIEDTVFNGTLPTATDVDGDTPLTYEIVTAPTKGTVIFTNAKAGQFTFTPTANVNGADSFTYRVKDAKGGISPTYTATLAIEAVNDAPTASDTKFTTLEDQDITPASTPIQGKLPAGTDVDGDTFQYQKVGNPANGTVTINADGTFTYTPNANFFGIDSFTYSVTDGKTPNSTSPTYKVDLTITEVNDKPSFTRSGVAQIAVNAGTAEKTFAGWATGFNPGATNEANQTLVKYEITNDNPAIFDGAVTIDNVGILKFKPAATVTSIQTANITVKAKDSGGIANGGIDLSDAQTLTITVKPRPTVQVSSPTKDEADTNLEFVVTLSDAPAETLTYEFATADGTAKVADNDYVAANGTLTFNANQTQSTITVAIKDDKKFETDETFTLNIAGVAGTGTITNIDAKPTVKVTGLSRAEGSSGDTNFEFDVAMTGETYETVTLNYATVAGTATAGKDFTAATGSLTIQPGQSSKITIKVAGDKVYEANEAFTLNVSSTNQLNTLSVLSATATIEDDDPSSTMFMRSTQTGEVMVREFRGATFYKDTSVLTVADQAWQIQQIADFDQDGDSDLLWRNNQSGVNVFWKMDGVKFESAVLLPSVTDLNWKIVTSANILGDASRDLLWRNTSTGQLGLWELNGMAVKSYSVLSIAVADPTWQIQVVGDFTMDGKADLLWRNTASGQLGLWEMDGARIVQYSTLQTVDPVWQLVGAADFDKDGDLDLTWYKPGISPASDQFNIWDMNGPIDGSAKFLTPPSPGQNWKFAGIVDLDLDLSKDLLYYNMATGEVWWLPLTGLTSKGNPSKITQLPNLSWKLEGLGELNPNNVAI